MKSIPLRLTDDQYDVLRALAFEQRISMAEMVRRAIERAYSQELRGIREGRVPYLAREPKGEEALREYTEAEIERFLADDQIDEETAQAVRRLLARMQNKGKSL